MLNLRRSLLLAVTLAVLVGWVSPGYGQSADDAQAALRDGITQFQNLDFRAAKQVLLSVDREKLSSDDRQTLDEYLDKVDPAIEQQGAAMEAYRSAEQAMRDGELAAAKEGFATAAASEYLPAASRQDARAQLAMVERKMVVLAEVAAALEEGPQPEVVEEAPAETDADEQPLAVGAPAGEAAPAAVENSGNEADAPEAEPAAELAEAAPVAAAAEPVEAIVTDADESADVVAGSGDAVAEAAAPVVEPVHEYIPVEQGESASLAQSDEVEPQAVPSDEPMAVPSDEPTVVAPDEPIVVSAPQEPVTAIDDRGARAEELIALGEEAIQANQPDRAIGYFQRALAMDPDNVRAQQQLNSARQMAVTAGDGGILSRLEANRRIARQTAEVEYDQALTRSYELLARADNAAEFDGAGDSARVARNALETNKTLYSEAEYRERLARVDEQLDLVETRREQWSQQRVQRQVAEIQEREALRREQEGERRDTKIAQLKDRAKVLRSEAKYELALEVVQQILNIDPNENWAAEQVGILEQFVLLQQDKAVHQEQRDQEQKVLVDLRRSEIPWYELIKYPEDWKELSRRREPFGAELASVGSQADRELRQLLQQKIPADLAFEGDQFSDVIAFLRDITNSNIVVKWTALSILGIDETTPVNIRLSNVTFEKALKTILDYVGGFEPLGYMIDDGVITISTRDDLATKTYTDVYDIRDLIVRVPNFVAPRLDLGAAGGEEGTTGGIELFEDEGGDGEDDEGNIPTRAEIIFNITSLIQETIDPLSWQQNGGEVGSIRELHGQLVVTQTSQNHQSLINLIRKLREARALQVSIEARFITVNSGFLNSIGLDLDFFFNIGSRLGSASVVDPFTGAVVPTTTGASGWGTHAPGDNKFTPLAVGQNSAAFTNMIGVQSPLGAGSIGGQVENSALSVAGTFLDDIQVDFLIQATQAHSSTRSLTAPRLTLFNGQRAFVLVATQQAYVSDLEPVVADNVAILDPIPGLIASGSVLDVEATISADRRYVTLTVRPTVANVIAFREFAVNETAGGGGEDEAVTVSTGRFELPTMSVQRLETTVSVPDGGTLLLGGQKLAGEVEREMGVPLLNKIPIINRAFTNRGTVRDEQTLLILIKPKIIIQREEEERQHPE